MLPARQHTDVPREPSANRLSKLRHLARTGDWICVGAMLLVAGYVVYLGMRPAALTAYLAQANPSAPAMDPNHPNLPAALLSLVPVMTLGITMWVARALFRLLGQARLFDEAVPRLLVRLGAFAVCTCLSGIAARTLIPLIIPNPDPHARPNLVLGVSEGEMAALIVGLLFYAFALVMREAMRVHEENQGFI